MLQTIKSRLIAICMLIVFAAVGIATLASYVTVSRHTHQQVSRQLAELGKAQAESMGAWVRKEQDIVTALTALPQIDAPDAALTQALQSGRLEQAYIGTADHKFLSVPLFSRPPGYDPTLRPWYKLAQSQPGTAVLTAPYVSASTGNVVVTFARTMASGQAVAALNVALTDVIATLKSIKPTPSGLAFLLDQKGNIVAHPDAALTLKPVANLSGDFTPELIARAGSDAEVEAKIGDARFIVHSAPVPGTDWVLMLAAERNEALAALSAILGSAGVVLVVVALAAVLVSVLVVGRLLQDLGRVRDAMDEIGSGSGDLTQRLAASGQDEIADIAKSFNQFVAKIETVMIDVRQTSQSIAVASREIAVGNQDLSQRTEESASNLQQTASSMEQLTHTVRHSADSAATASHLAVDAAGAARQGGEV
ncbi:MAG: HAMP domain-containing protein, partial [Burkholderiaceae bacterium]|nr:HAMP domain-containing protein [Burkholderiaceae bacterium]